MLAIEKHATRLRDDAEQREADRARMMQEYSSLMLADPDANAERIAELMFDLDLSPEQVEADARAVTEARRLQGLAACVKRASEDSNNEIQRVAAIEYVAKQRARLDSESKIHAANYASSCKRAVDELVELAADHPHLFTTVDGEVRLHGDDIQQQGESAYEDRKLMVIQARLSRIDREVRMATQRLERDIADDERGKVAAWKRWLMCEQRKLKRQCEQLDTTPADATEGDSDEE